MSAFQFATCDRRFALSFLRQSYPSYVVEDTAENIGPLLDMIESDLIRVQDPNFHQPCQIVPGKQWDPARECEVISMCQATLNNLPRKQA